jgi:lysophospholipase L1-like esterase
MPMRRVWAPAVLVASSVVLTVLAIDLGLHLVYPDTRVIGPHAQLGTLPQPNLVVRKAFGGHERVVTIRTNAFGLRGGPLPGPKAPGVRRVLAIGDSFTFGAAVQGEEAWPRQLELRLGDEPSAARSEVVNAGVSGFGTAHQLLLYRLLQASLRPDVVVLGFSVVNDVLDNLCIDEGTYEPRRNAPCFILEDDRLVLHEPLALPSPSTPRWVPGARAMALLRGQMKNFVLGNPAVLDLAARAGIRPELPYMPATIASWYDERYGARGWALTRRLLGELERTLDEHGVQMVILVVPTALQAEEDNTGKKAILRSLAGERPPVRAFLEDPLRPQRMLLDFCRDAGIACVDPLPALREARRRGERVYYPIDQHWTPAAHAIAADLVARRLGELPGPSPTLTATSPPAPGPSP